MVLLGHQAPVRTVRIGKSNWRAEMLTRWSSLTRCNAVLDDCKTRVVVDRRKVWTAQVKVHLALAA